MNKKKPRKHHKLIIEWALGAQIQVYIPSIKKWVDTDSPPWDSDSVKLRIRPKRSNNSLTAEEYAKEYSPLVNIGEVFNFINEKIFKESQKEELVLDEDEILLIKSLRRSPPYDVFPEKSNLTYVDGDDDLQSYYSPIAFNVNGKNNTNFSYSIRVALTNMAKKSCFSKKYK